MSGCCFFCDPETKKSALHQETYFYSRFDRYPVTPGHALVIPQRHVVSLADLTEVEWANLKSAIHETLKIVSAISLRDLYNSFVRSPESDKSRQFCEQMLSHVGIDKAPDSYNFGINDGEAAGRTVHHFHFHIIPRYFGDMEDPSGGVRHVIPSRGNYKKC